MKRTKRTLLKSAGIVYAGLMILPSVAMSQAKPQSKLDYTLDLVKYAYVDTVNDKALTDEAMRAIIKELDPHSVYIPIEELREMNEPLVGKFEGIGVQFNIHEDTIMVTATIPGGPSEKLGIAPGDRIVNIDGKKCGKYQDHQQ